MDLNSSLLLWGQQSNVHMCEQPPCFQFFCTFSQHCPRGTAEPCLALGTQSQITAQRHSSHPRAEQAAWCSLPKSAFVLLKWTGPAKASVAVKHVCLTGGYQSEAAEGECSFQGSVWLARPGCSRGRARSLPALQAPHLLAQPDLHVDLGSPCGIRWGGGGKTTVSFTHRLSKPGAISLGLAEESSTLLQLFNPCSAKPLCVPRAMTASVCRGGICRSVIILKLPKATQEGWVILRER